MTGHVTILKQRPLNRKRGWTTTFLTPERAWSQRDNYQAHLYSKEDCGRNDPSMSPGLLQLFITTYSLSQETSYVYIINVETMKLTPRGATGSLCAGTC